ncbi:MAG TPA: amidase domain-containing protein [Limnochordia bacterium]|nr:amidase domain-containing protein [Limnochordia bacterium]
MRSVRWAFIFIALGIGVIGFAGGRLGDAFGPTPVESGPKPIPLTPAEEDVKVAVRDLWQRLDEAAASNRPDELPNLFDGGQSGAASLEHARARIAFVQAWAKARGVIWQTPEVSVRTPAIRFGGGNPPAYVDVTAIISERWTYHYPPDASGNAGVQSFGLGRDHYLRLVRVGDAWRIQRDWFTDPLDQDTRIPGPALPASHIDAAAALAPGAPALDLAAADSYDRAGAVRYADRYCGSAPGCGNDGRYNPTFIDYNGIGGDCTNFLSQVLHVGGGLPLTWGWGYNARTGEGSVSWVQAPSMVGYLLGSGRAVTVARGTYDKVAGRIAQLQAGDVVAYIEKGKIVHLGFVVGRDPRGYALVDSHTADRYHVPWDIGWDRGATYILLHITR